MVLDYVGLSNTKFPVTLLLARRPQNAVQGTRQKQGPVQSWLPGLASLLIPPTPDLWMVWGDWGLTLIALISVEFSRFIANTRFPSSLIFTSSTPSIWNQLPTLGSWIQHIAPLPDFCLPSPKPTLDTTVISTGNTKSGGKMLPLSVMGLSSTIGNPHIHKVTSTTEANTWTMWMLLVGASTWMATVKFLSSFQLNLVQA